MFKTSTNSLSISLIQIFSSSNMKKNGTTTAVICFVMLSIVVLVDIIIKLSGSSSTPSTPTSEHKYFVQRETTWKPMEPITCDRSHYDYNLCHLNRPLLLDPATTTLHSLDPTNLAHPPTEKIRPFPPKPHWMMPLIGEVTLTASPPNKLCVVTHNSPVLVFSVGGLTGNFLHDFNDVLIPLFNTVNSLFSGRDPILAVVNCSSRWMTKYSDLLRQFTRHPILDMDKETKTHCFPSATVGLIYAGAMTVGPTGPSKKMSVDFHGPMIMVPTLAIRKTLLDFHELLAATYSDGRKKIGKEPISRPQLLLIDRKFTRKILNLAEVRLAAEEVGFKVEVFEPTHTTSLHEAYRLVESSHALVGVHGAGLTHELFLRRGAVVVQVVPIGFNWVAEICFGNPAVQLGLEYIEYGIQEEESSLIEKNGKESLELSNPGAIVNGSWSNIGIYLSQDVQIDIMRFRGCLEEAYKKAKKFMVRESLIIDR